MTDFPPSDCARTAGRPRDVDVAARLDALLEAAGKVFLEKGYGNASLAAVAREAHVALRTIYVKFGGKAGLFNAVVARGLARYGAFGDMLSDPRPVDAVLADFAVRLLHLMSTPQVVRMHRMVIAEACSHPELARTFDRAGPGQILDMLGHYFARPDIAAGFRPDIGPEQLALHLFNCILGDQVTRLMFDPPTPPCETQRRSKAAQGLAFFYKTARLPSSYP